MLNCIVSVVCYWTGLDELSEGFSPPLALLIALVFAFRSLWLASSGTLPALNCKLLPLQQLVEDFGFLCRDRSKDLSHARLLRCRFVAKALP